MLLSTTDDFPFNQELSGGKSAKLCLQNTFYFTKI